MRRTQLAMAGTTLALAAGIAAARPVLAVQATQVERESAGRVTGAVLDERTRQPMAGVRVVLDDGSEMHTSPEGLFSFAGTQPGLRRIAALTRGCRAAGGTFEVDAGGAARLELLLDAAGSGVRATRVERNGERVHVIPGERLRELEHLSLLRVVKREVPGLMGGDQVDHGRHTGLSSRGTAGMRSGGTPLLMLNDTRIRHRVSDVLAEIRTADVVRVEVIPGSSATTLHGPDAAYGLIRVFVRDGPDRTDPGTPADRCRVDWADF